MAYTKTTWRNNQSPAINADNLNHIEQGVYEAHQDIAENTQNIENLTTQTGANTSAIALEKTQRQQADTAETLARENADNLLSARMDTFTQLPSGSTSGDAELIDIRVGADGVTYPTAGDAVRGQVTDLKSDLDNTYYTVLGENLINPSKNVVGLLSSDGTVDGSSTGYATSDFIEIEPNTDYVFTCWVEDTGLVASSRERSALYDASKQFVSASYQDVNNTTSITFNSGSAKYARVSWNKSRLGFLKKAALAPTSYVLYSETYYTHLIVQDYKNGSIPKDALDFDNSLALCSNINLFNVDDVVDNNYINSSGQLESNSSYKTSGFIPVRQGYDYTISPRCRMKAFYTDADFDSYIPSSWDGTDRTTPHTFTSLYSGYMCFSYASSATNLSVVESYAGTTTRKIEEGIALSNTQTKQIREDVVSPISSLYGKKWAVCGDSFTQGVTNTKMPSGQYEGKPYTYPYIIATRQGITLYEFFDGGRTLAFPENPSTFDNSLTCPTADWYYQNIPSDADFITIYLGINDEHHATGGGDGEDPTGYIPLGTIDDSTTSSYYGAWNVVLEWLIENRPNAHIGIIVTNGLSIEGYRDAQIAIARKYGIPFIDMNGDDRTPAMLRTVNSNISASIKQILKEKWSVDYPSNQHPNDDAQLFESHFIENFLRSI